MSWLFNHLACEQQFSIWVYSLAGDGGAGSLLGNSSRYFLRAVLPQHGCYRNEYDGVGGVVYNKSKIRGSE